MHGPVMGKSSSDLRKMVGVRGFEPPTPASRTQCSTRLSHTPTFFSTRARSRRCAEEGAYSHGFRTSQAGNSRLLKKSLVDENSSVFRCCIPESLGVSHRSSQQRTAGRTGPAGEWCNGNTAVFGTVVQGSSPCSPANHSLGGMSIDRLNFLSSGIMSLQRDRLLVGVVR